MGPGHATELVTTWGPVKPGKDGIMWSAAESILRGRLGVDVIALLAVAGGRRRDGAGREHQAR